MKFFMELLSSLTIRDILAVAQLLTTSLDCILKIIEKKCRIPQRSPALIYPPLPFNEEIANDGYRFLKRPYTLSICHS